MEYLLKSSAIIFIFYICYKIFLQRDTFFESNRWFLLFGIIVASSISFVVIPEYIEYTPIALTEFTSSQPLIDTSAPIESESYDYSQLFYWTYIAGISFFLGRLCIQLMSLRSVLRHGTKIQHKSFTIIESTKDITPFSFFNFIVYNPNQFNSSELKHVINHEKAHSKHLHSIDNIMIQIACILLWFNPFIWLYKKALLQNLEFIADQKAQRVSPCQKSYQTVLLKASVQNYNLAITNNFYTSLIKKRIIMLHKSKSKKWNQIKFLIVLPLLAFFVMSFNTKEMYVETASYVVNEENTKAQEGETIEIIITTNTSDKDLEAIKKELESKGISFNFSNNKRNDKGELISLTAKFKNGKNVTNYSVSGENGIKPFKFTSSNKGFSVGPINNNKNDNTFILTSSNGTKVQSSTSGNIVIKEDKNENNNTSVKIKTDSDSDNSIYLTQKSKTFTITTDDDDSNIFINADGDEPLFVVDGHKVKKSIFEDVDSDDIESVFVLKGDRAIKKFGDEAKNGAIVMTKRGSKNIFIDTDDDVVIETKTRLHIDSDGKNSPLIIVDEEIVEEEDMKELNPNQIDKIEVIKDKEAIRGYGTKGENGVIKIYTKKGEGIVGKKNKVLIIEEENESPYEIQVSKVNVRYELEEIISEYIITKTASDAYLESQKKQLLKQGIKAKFSKVKRNKAGEITSIKISLDDNEGRTSSASWKEKINAIPDIAIGKSKDDKLYIRAIGD